MIAVSRCRTERLIRAECLLCGAIVEITVVDLAPGADPQAWLDEQPIEEWERIHERHERASA